MLQRTCAALVKHNIWLVQNIVQKGEIAVNGSFFKQKLGQNSDNAFRPCSLSAATSKFDYCVGCFATLNRTRILPVRVAATTDQPKIRVLLRCFRIRAENSIISSIFHPNRYTHEHDSHISLFWLPFWSIINSFWSIDHQSHVHTGQHTVGREHPYRGFFQ